LRTTSGNLLGDLAGLVVLGRVVPQHVGSRMAEGAGDRLADARTRPRHQRNLTLQLFINRA